MNQTKSILLCLIFLLSYITSGSATTITHCTSCIKAFDLNNTIIGNVISLAPVSIIIFGNAAYNSLVESTPPINITGTITTPYNIQPITDIINTELPCDCNATYSGLSVSGITIYPGRTCFTTTSSLDGLITFDALGDPSSVFVLTFQSSFVYIGYNSVLINNAQPCNINLIIPGQFDFVPLQPLHGNFFAYTITITLSTTVYGGLYATNNLSFGSHSTVYGCICQLPENQYNQCTPKTNHKQIVYNVKCSNSLSCPP
jgi:hypothetical protein